MTKTERKKFNMQRHQEILENHAEEIKNIVENTEQIEYTGPVSTILHTDTVGALFQCDENEKVAILNFASFTHPGGGFLNGAKAQEESLCGESWLYEVLEQFKDTWYSNNWKTANKGLYSDRLLYSPDVPFIRYDKIRKADVITCAAPNWGYYKDSNDEVSFKKMKNTRALRRRMGMILRTAEEHNIDTLILGAWGCGAFKQDPNLIACQFKLAQSYFPKVKCIYAILDSGEILDTFRKTFKEIPE